MKTETAHFTVDADWLTDTCRRLWNDEDRPESALKILMEGLQGITEEQAIGICEGRFKLTGDSTKGMDLVPDTAKLSTVADHLKRLKKQRDEEADRAADLVQMVNGDTTVVASPTGPREVPLRKTRRRGDREAGRRGLAEGYNWNGTDGRDPNDKEPPVYRERSDMFKGCCAPSAPPSTPTPSPAPAPPPIPPPTPTKEITADNGWLSPEGKFYKCNYWGHNNLADQLADAKLIKGLNPDDEGWVKCQRGGEKEGCFWEPDPLAPNREGRLRPTEIQMRLVRDRCLEQKWEIPYWAKET